jgi:hypothetical protein
MPNVIILLIIILDVIMFYLPSVKSFLTDILIIIIVNVAILITFKMSVLMLFVTMPVVPILIIVILGVNKLYIVLEFFYYLYTSYYHAESCNSDNYYNNDECNAVCYNACCP